MAEVLAKQPVQAPGEGRGVTGRSIALGLAMVCVLLPAKRSPTGLRSSPPLAFVTTSDPESPPWLNLPSLMRI